MKSVRLKVRQLSIRVEAILDGHSEIAGPGLPCLGLTVTTPTVNLTPGGMVLVKSASSLCLLFCNSHMAIILNPHIPRQAT